MSRPNSAAIATALVPMVAGATEVAGRRVGLVGFAAVGQALTVRFGALGCPVAYWTRRRRDPRDAHGATFRELDQLLASSDVLVDVTAFAPQTRGLLDRARLALLPDGAVLVGVSRGGSSTRRPRPRRWRPGGSPERLSTSSPASRCPPTARCGPATGSSSPRTWPARPGSRSPGSWRESSPTCAGRSPGSRYTTSSTGLIRGCAGAADDRLPAGSRAGRGRAYWCTLIPSAVKVPLMHPRCHRAIARLTRKNAAAARA